jgi:hypothetical protein
VFVSCGGSQGKGFTALHLASQLGLTDCARVLLVLGGASADMETRDGQTPILLTRNEETRDLLRVPPSALVVRPEPTSVHCTAHASLCDGYECCAPCTARL